MTANPIHHLYLSPHLDDAVYSCGASIYRQCQRGERVRVVTICAGEAPQSPLSEFAQLLHSRWEQSAGVAIANIIASRRAEDQMALQRLGAEMGYFAELDCIYRRAEDGRWLYPSRESIFGEVASAELAQLGKLVVDWQALDGITSETCIYSPLAIGNHVDHQRVFHAARLWQAQSGLKFRYYEDFPYASLARQSDIWQARAEWQRRVSGWQMEFEMLTPADLQAKALAMSDYVSQFGSFWRDSTHLLDEIYQHARLYDGYGLCERFWLIP
ncbi:MAG TPA: PIG-L family deacetylase [Anaerolineales bacterium]|nr:PIG-L family deacetylase [Anaerolineales bacterium]